MPDAEVIRYLVTIIGGLCVDMLLALAAILVGASVTVAAGIGVASGAAFNYLLLEHWAFRAQKQGTKFTRPLKFLGAFAVTFTIRVCTIWLLVASLPLQTPPIIILGCGIAVSFIANFVLSKYWVFQSVGQTITQSKE